MVSKQKAHVAVVGATGAVGCEMIHCLEALGFPVGQIDLVASCRSSGKKVETPWGACIVQDAENYDFAGVDIALFSAGKKVSLALAPKAVKAGALVIDNTSAFRFDADKALVVPEVNGALIDLSARIIANPNCSTIQMVLALSALDRAVGIEYVRVATYQSCSGAGQKGINALMEETREAMDGKRPQKSAVHARTIAFDVVPQIGAFEDDGFSEEEHKMMVETKKILSRPDLRVSATCVRVPVARSHCEVVHVGMKRRISVQEACAILDAAPGLRVTDKNDRLAYPTAVQGEGKFETLVGRVRIDPVDQGLIFWIVSDNLLKGAALNAVQIACAAWNHGRIDSNEG